MIVKRAPLSMSAIASLRGGGETTWPTRVDLPRLPEDEADRFNPGEAGHEKIERAALPFFDAGRRRAIYFGNWQRDMSQFLAPAVALLIGEARARPIYELVFDLLDVLAEKDFDRRLDRF